MILLSFSAHKKYIEEVDIAIANLETTLSGAGQNYSGYPMFNSLSRWLKL